jgi:UDP-N-acetylglucosamine--N-acetylmuramyl-(pentapeptide) pyrophosphoryl-undecaprenol N-acetylglucosamine transferase
VSIATTYQPLRIIIAGGGTGGHIFPAIAIAKALQALRPQVTILFVGAKGKMEMQKVPEAGYAIEGLDIAGFNRTALWKNISLPFKLIKSFWQVSNIMKRVQPHAVIGVGGYSTYPVLKYAQSKRIPTFIHESNAFAGKSNILLGKQATTVFVATQGMESFFPKEKIVIAGNPVRTSITNNIIDSATAKSMLGLKNKPTILSIGGSLGAASINKAIATYMPQLKAANVQLIWQTGKTATQALQAFHAPSDGICVFEFIKDMDVAYAAADVIISRAGAMAVTEIACVGKAAIFVPYPHAAEDHQTANAQALVNQDAAIMIKDTNAQNALVPTALALIENEVQRNSLAANIKRNAISNADVVIATHIINTITSK